MDSNKQEINKNASGFKRLPRAIMCSLKGYKVAWKFESGFRQYLVISLCLLPISFFVSQSRLHWLLLFASLVLLLITEIINSAIEAVCDALTLEYNERIGRAKDLGSAAVFSAVILAIIIWSMAIYEYFSP